MTRAKKIYANFSYLFPSTIAFILPFGINYSPVIILWAISFFCFDNVSQGLKTVFKNPWTYIFFTFFLIHVSGYFFSDNKAEALTIIERKLSFFAIPLLLFGSQSLSEIQIKNTLISFVSGCFLASIVSLIRAAYLWIVSDVNAFFYSDFTFLMHPSYFAMYLIFSQIIVILYYKNWLYHLEQLNLKIALISSVLLLCIFLASSKMGLITAAILIPVALTIQLYKNGFKKTIVVFYVIFIATVFVAYQLFPKPFERIKMAVSVASSVETIDKTDAESTAVRILIWKEASELIKRNIWFGVTPGDVNDELCRVYAEKGLTGALRKKLNTHNQYLQTFLGTGVAGFVLIIIMTIGLLLYGLYKKKLLLIVFSVLIIMNFLVESMLQAQAGFMFYAFFACFFFALRFK